MTKIKKSLTKKVEGKTYFKGLMWNVKRSWKTKRREKKSNRNVKQKNRRRLRKKQGKKRKRLCKNRLG